MRGLMGAYLGSLPLPLPPPQPSALGGPKNGPLQYQFPQMFHSLSILFYWVSSISFHSCFIVSIFFILGFQSQFPYLSIFFILGVQSQFPYVFIFVILGFQYQFPYLSMFFILGVQYQFPDFSYLSYWVSIIRSSRFSIYCCSYCFILGFQ